MANLNVRKLDPVEARAVSKAAAARGETIKEYVLRAARIRADLEGAVEALLAAGLPIPDCPFAAAANARGAARAEIARHAQECPSCTGAAVQRLVGKVPALGWAELARDLRLSGDGMERLTARFARLAPRDQELLRDLYGLPSQAEPYRRRLTLSQQARRMGLSRERVRQLAERARAALRPPAGAPSADAGGATPRRAARA